MPEIKRLRLDPQLDPWEQQPGETGRRYEQFAAFRDLGPGRTVQKASETLAKSGGYLRAIAGPHLWRERAQAWDRNRAQIADAVWAEEGRKSAETTHKLLNLAKGKLAQALSGMEPNSLTESETIRLLDVVAGRHTSLFGETLALTGPDGGPIRITTRDDFEGLTLEQRARRMIELGENSIRRGRSILGLDDDEDEDDQEERPD
ncbi:hypothetical protein [Streptomyces sp. NBC_01689]|uniref:hypothetical protein n=1 Tax=Streptomyces sp. NBC_01689 TaxID=2975911 RepID=UPI002E322EEF|nr:hypothetical protein [Streptomyces sp. NBC_01689]